MNVTVAPTGKTVSGVNTSAHRPAALPELPVGARSILPTVWITFVTTVLLALAFSFGNVWDLGKRLGVEEHVAPLIGPTVDITAIGLLVVVPWLVLAGVPAEKLSGANRLMFFAGALTLALNSAPAAIKGWTQDDPNAWGLAAVEAIVPSLLIAWSHVGPTLIALYVEVRSGVLMATAEAARADAESASRRAEERVAEIAAAVDAAVAEAVERAAAEHSVRLTEALTAAEEGSAELLASERGYRVELEAALASEQRVAAELDASREALEKIQAELKEARREARDAKRATASGGSRGASDRAPRRTLDEWVDLAKDALPEWQIETPAGPVIGSALDLSSAGTISNIRKRLEADRLALAGGAS
jgi:hypothetical protein